MAQNIKLKRSSVSGKVPTTAQLEPGEIAINTADGKLYFERDDSSIQTIVTTNALITGSLNINGTVNVSGSIIASGSLTVRGTTSVVQEGISVSGTTTLTVKSISTGSYEGAFLDYLIVSGSNKRAGTLTSVWTASDIEWKDVSTLDLGSTEGAEFTPTLAGSNANIVLAVPAGTWTVKGHLRYM
jgi:hypothetical protein